MAARWRGEDGDLNAGNSDFLASNIPNEFVPSRRDVEGVVVDVQSCMENSILAIFEDSTVAAEGKNGVEEESETLLSALTEMLDSVEDDDGTPFDTLPNTKLLAHPESRDNSVEPLLADRLKPRCKSPNVTLTIKIEEEKKDECKIKRSSPQQLSTLFHAKTKKAEAEVELLTSTSLVNLVRLMHPYCLQLHVEEEGDKLRREHALFSREEVWKYKRPTEECDEEINVVSDDEVTVKETKEGDEKSDGGKLLKSVLLNGNSSRAPPSKEKKRVSFGHVQVASIDESVKKGLNGKNLTSGLTSETVSVPLSSTKALENPAGSPPEPQTHSSEVKSNDDEVLPPKGEAKAKSLSLQQYRQLRQKRQPLVEKQRNYTTKWPSVPEPPMELTPILCLQGQRQNSCAPKTAHHCPDGRGRLHRCRTPGYKTHRTSAPPRPQLSEAKPSTHLHRSALKRQRTESQIFSHASPLPDVTAETKVIVSESKISPVKKPTLLSSDPPNPVLLPLPVNHTTSPSSDVSSSEPKVEFLINRDSKLDGTRHLKEIQSDSSGTSASQQQSSSSWPKPEVLLLNQNCTPLIQEMKNKFTEIDSGISSRSPALCTTTTESSSRSEKQQPQKRNANLTKETTLEPKTPLSPSPDTARQIKSPSPTPYCSQPLSHKEAPPGKPPPEEPSPILHLGCSVQSATPDSGIEAPDLTSLLQQFEETQAKEESVCELKPVSATNPPPDGHLDRTQPVGPERASRLVLTPPVGPLKVLSTSESPSTPKTLRNLPHVQLSNIPEPLGTDVILSTQQDLPARRRNPLSKAIQIIDPRPLPSKKTHTYLSELPAAHTSAHIYSSVSSDHDYCGPVDRTQRSRAFKLKEVSKGADEEMTTRNSTAAECNKQNATISTAIIAVSTSAKAVMQRLSEQPTTRSDTKPSTDKVLLPSDSAATEQACAVAAEDQTAPCTLPTPPPSPLDRRREKRRYGRRSSRSDSSCSSRSSSSSSSSSSASPSPKRKKHRHKRSESSSCSSSSRSVSCSPPRRYRWSYSRSRCSRSRSRSWSQSRSPSRSRSPSPRVCRKQWRDVYSRRESRKLRKEHEMRIQKLKAIEERRVVYVGRICRSMTHDELRERFTQFGEVECVSLHFRDRGDHYGFVTFYNMEDAFAAIDNGGKLRKPDELPFDICFGGRRQFCNSHYADLDANRDADGDPSPPKSKIEDLDFDSLLKQAQRGLKR